MAIEICEGFRKLVISSLAVAAFLPQIWPRVVREENRFIHMGGSQSRTLSNRGAARRRARTSTRKINLSCLLPFQFSSSPLQRQRGHGVACPTGAECLDRATSLGGAG